MPNNFTKQFLLKKTIRSFFEGSDKTFLQLSLLNTYCSKSNDKITKQELVQELERQNIKEQDFYDLVAKAATKDFYSDPNDLLDFPGEYNITKNICKNILHQDILQNAELSKTIEVAFSQDIEEVIGWEKYCEQTKHFEYRHFMAVYKIRSKIEKNIMSIFTKNKKEKSKTKDKNNIIDFLQGYIKTFNQDKWSECKNYLKFIKQDNKVFARVYNNEALDTIEVDISEFIDKSPIIAEFYKGNENEKIVLGLINNIFDHSSKYDKTKMKNHIAQADELFDIAMLDCEEEVEFEKVIENKTQIKNNITKTDDKIIYEDVNNLIIDVKAFGECCHMIDNFKLICKKTNKRKIKLYDLCLKCIEHNNVCFLIGLIRKFKISKQTINELYNILVETGDCHNLYMFIDIFSELYCNNSIREPVKHCYDLAVTNINIWTCYCILKTKVCYEALTIDEIDKACEIIANSNDSSHQFIKFELAKNAIYFTQEQTYKLFYSSYNYTIPRFTPDFDWRINTLDKKSPEYITQDRLNILCDVIINFNDKKYCLALVKEVELTENQIDILIDGIFLPRNIIGYVNKNIGDIILTQETINDFNNQNIASYICELITTIKNLTKKQINKLYNAIIKTNSLPDVCKFVNENNIIELSYLMQEQLLTLSKFIKNHIKRHNYRNKNIDDVEAKLRLLLHEQKAVEHIETPQEQNEEEVDNNNKNELVIENNITETDDKIIYNDIEEPELENNTTQQANLTDPELKQLEELYELKELMLEQIKNEPVTEQTICYLQNIIDDIEPEATLCDNIIIKDEFIDILNYAIEKQKQKNDVDLENARLQIKHPAENKNDGSLEKNTLEIIDANSKENKKGKRLLLITKDVAISHLKQDFNKYIKKVHTRLREQEDFIMALIEMNPFLENKYIGKRLRQNAKFMLKLEVKRMTIKYYPQNNYNVISC